MKNISVLDFLKWWWPSMLTLSVVLWLTLAPDPVPTEGTMWFEGADKLVHMVMMGGLASAVMFDYRRKKTADKRNTLSCRAVVIICCAVAVFSLADEFAQDQMNLGRTGDAWDLLADCVGILLSALTAPRVINWIFRERHAHQP